MKCKYCGKPMDPSSSVCEHCGKKQYSSKKTGSQGNAAAFPRWLVPAAAIAAILLIAAGVLALLLGNPPVKNPPEQDSDVSVVVTNPPTEETEEASETVTETETQTEAETEPPFKSDVDWANAYYETMQEFEGDHKDVNPERGIKYRLLYIDDDEIPELFIQSGDASALYTYAQDEVKRIYRAESPLDEKLIGVRTRCGTYLSSRVNSEGERFAVNTLRNGTVTESESYHSDGNTNIVNGTEVNLVSYTQFVRAKQAAYQLTDIPIYYRAEALKALEKAAKGEDIPDVAPEETTVALSGPDEKRTTTVTGATAEASEASQSGDKRFTVYAGTYTWSQAKAQCEAKGGHLAYIKSAEDYNSVMEAVRAADASLSYLWVGGQTTITSNGVIAKWNDGSSTSYLDSAGLWFGHEPSGKDGDITEPYMMLWNPGGGWSFNDNSDSCVDIYASGTMGYICEFD